MHPKNTNELIEFANGDDAYKHFAKIEYTYPMHMAFIQPREYFDTSDECVYESTWLGGPPQCWAKKGNVTTVVTGSYEGSIYFDGIGAMPDVPGMPGFLGEAAGDIDSSDNNPGPREK